LLSGVKVLHASGTSQASAMTSASLALIRAHFPKLPARQVVARALWGVHNGVGLNAIGHRINDKIGYGDILANEAMASDFPTNFPNPIYDAWQKAFSSAPSGSDSSPGSTPPSSSPATIPSGPGAAPSPVRRADSGGSSNGVLIGVIVGIIVLLIIIVAVVLSRRQRSTVSPGPR
jgi:hypothetical protein